MNSAERRVSTECYPCIVRQAASIATLMGIKEPQKKSLLERTLRYLLETHGEGITVQHIARRVTDDAVGMMNKPDHFDPYKLIKIRSNDIALKYVGMFETKIKESDSPLETALTIAAAGNIIDFGAKDHADLDIEKELGSIDQRGFGTYDYDKFYKRLSIARTLLYICDNSGEIVLDKIFIEEIKKTFPSLNIVCAMREKAIINDALIEDALYVGLDRVAKVISSGSIYPGTILEETSPEFRRFYDESDLVVSKGQGNFETLLDSATGRIFFILRIKCAWMAELSGVRPGDLVLMQGRQRVTEGRDA